MKTRFSVKCRRAVYCLNRLYRLGVSPEGVECLSGLLLFRVRRRESALVESFLREEGFAFEVGGYRGARHSFRRLLSRPFLLFSALLTVASLIFSSNFIYDYSIYGNRYVNSESIALVLRQNRVSGVTPKSSIDLSRIKRDITAIEGISFASVKVVGTRLEVEVKESLPAVDPDAVEYLPFVASHDAVVTKIVAESGTPRVSVGQVVSAGDLLIEPFYAFTEGGSPAPARGEVWGRVIYQKEVVLPAMTMERVRTGERCRRRVLTLFGKRVGKEPSPPYENYEFTERVVYRGIGVTVTERLYRRVEEQPLCHDFDAEGTGVLQNAARDLLMELPCLTYERSAMRVTQKRVDNMLITVIYYTVEQRIDSLSLVP